MEGILKPELLPALEPGRVWLHCLKITEAMSLQVTAAPLSLLFVRLKRLPTAPYMSCVVNTCLYLGSPDIDSPVLQHPWSVIPRTRQWILGYKSLPSIKQSLCSAGHAPNTTNIQLVLFTLRACCCLMFYLASTATPRSFQQFVPSLHPCLRLFCLSCRTWHLSFLDFRRLLLFQSSDFWKVLRGCSLVISAILWSLGLSAEDYKSVSTFRLHCFQTQKPAV